MDMNNLEMINNCINLIPGESTDNKTSAGFEVHHGKSVLMNMMIFNCTRPIPLKFDFDVVDVGHTIVFGPARTGMSFTQIMNPEFLSE